jgi:DtxR family Mn-dependent transcriptional regulator
VVFVPLNLQIAGAAFLGLAVTASAILLKAWSAVVANTCSAYSFVELWKFFPALGVLSMVQRRGRKRRELGSVAGDEVSETTERYVEAVYRVREPDGSARTGKIAEALGVTGGSVTNTITGLQSQGLVRLKPYRGVELTPRGEALALQVLRKHRLAERLLTDILGMKWSEVHATASRLSHAITGDVAGALERFLKNPETCPHGNPIPTATGKLKQTKAIPLDQLSTGQAGILVSVHGEKSDLFRHLESLGLLPGVPVRVEAKDPLSGAIIVNKQGSRFPLGRQLASSIHVRRT